MTALKGKSIDLCAHLTSSQTAQLDSDFQILEGTMNLVQAVYLNNAVAPFDNQQVRQALCCAIDRQSIMDMIADGTVRRWAAASIRPSPSTSCRSWCRSTPMTPPRPKETAGTGRLSQRL